MPSADYCKFENTAIDLANCVQHIKDGRPLPTSYEMYGYKAVLNLCRAFLEEADYFTPKVEMPDE